MYEPVSGRDGYWVCCDEVPFAGMWPFCSSFFFCFFPFALPLLLLLVVGGCEVGRPRGSLKGDGRLIG